RQPSGLYTVTTVMMIAPGKQTLIACHLMPLPMPPIGCGGGEVRGGDAPPPPGAHRSPNGTAATATFPPGCGWGARALAVARTTHGCPITAWPAQNRAQPSPCRGDQTSAGCPAACTCRL